MSFARLGLARGASEPEVRKAYARLIREYRPETHPREFAEIRAAYEQALAASRAAAQRARDEDSVETANAVELLRSIAAARIAREDDPPGPVAAATGAAGAGESPEPAPQGDPIPLPAAPPAPPAAWQAPAPDAAPGPAPAADVRQRIAAAVRSLLKIPADAGLEATDAALRKCLAEVRALHIDAQVEFEDLLRTAVLQRRPPPLDLLLCCARAFDWERRHAEFVRREGSYAAGRFADILELARARHEAIALSGNPWERALFLPRPRKAWSGWAWRIALARQRLQEWDRMCARPGMQALATIVDPRGRAALDGWVISSTVLLAAVLSNSAIVLGLFPGPVPLALAAQAAGIILLHVLAGAILLRLTTLPIARRFFAWHARQATVVRYGVYFPPLMVLFTIMALSNNAGWDPGVRTSGALLALVVCLWLCHAVELGIALRITARHRRAARAAWDASAGQDWSAWRPPGGLAAVRGVLAPPAAKAPARQEIETTRVSAGAPGNASWGERVPKFSWWWVLWIVFMIARIAGTGEPHH